MGHKPMKKTLTVLVILTITLITLTINFQNTKSQTTPKIIHVDDDNTTGPWNGTPEHPYQNITSALQHASPNDTIIVHNGTYKEHITITITLTLIGENKNKTIIDGNGTSTVITVNAKNTTITGFTIKNSGKQIGNSGIDLSSNQNNITNNTIENCYNGILLYYSNNNTIKNNTIKNNTYGIQTYYANNNTITKNNIQKNENGIYQSHSTQNHINTNTFQNNTIGIALLFESNNNTIIHNNFINNTQHITVLDTINKFDNGLEGNYWSNYQGTDQNQDGIGDTPYIIDVNNRDNKPLMGKYYEFTVTYEKEKINIPIISNSTISNFQYNKTLRTIKFNITAKNNTTSFTKITIPEKIVNKPHLVLINNQQINKTQLPQSNSTHTILYLKYNQTKGQIKILSEPYYDLIKNYEKLIEKYKSLQENYEKLNQTYQKLAANYTEIITKYNKLNQTYINLNQTFNQLQENYTELQLKFNVLNQTYQEILQNYINLNQTLTELAANYTEIMAKYSTLNQTYQKLTANYTSLAKDYNTILQEYQALNSTYQKTKLQYLNTHNMLLYISLVAITITIIAPAMTIKYYKKSKQQEKLVEKYKRELEQIKPLYDAHSQFQMDVKRREKKIQKFEEKYNITFKPHKSLEDIIKNLELKRKRRD